MMAYKTRQTTKLKKNTDEKSRSSASFFLNQRRAQTAVHKHLHNGGKDRNQSNLTVVFWCKNAGKYNRYDKGYKLGTAAFRKAPDEIFKDAIIFTFFHFSSILFFDLL